MDSRTDNRGGADVDAGGQVKFILTNPIKYAKILFTFMGEYLSFDNCIHRLADYCLIGTTSVFFGIFTLLLLVVCAFLDSPLSDCKRTLWIRGMNILSCFFAVVLIITALYVSFTPLQATTVKGVQFRYTFPLFFSLLCSIGIPIKKKVLDNSIGKFAIYFLLAFNLFASFYDAYIERIVQLI